MPDIQKGDGIAMTKEMVRYGRNPDNSKKNVLFTFQEGFGPNALVFFGVSRCKNNVDKFDRELGIVIAKGRALKARELLKENPQLLDDGVDLQWKSQKGVLSVSQIKELIAMFKRLDNK